MSRPNRSVPSQPSSWQNFFLIQPEGVEGRCFVASSAETNFDLFIFRPSLGARLGPRALTCLLPLSGTRTFSQPAISVNQPYFDENMKIRILEFSNFHTFLIFFVRASVRASVHRPSVRPFFVRPPARASASPRVDSAEPPVPPNRRTTY